VNSDLSGSNATLELLNKYLVISMNDCAQGINRYIYIYALYRINKENPKPTKGSFMRLNSDDTESSDTLSVLT
jgi:hypothetical protein